ncbi:acyl-CoA dehydrogenase [Nakamurella sp. YIM 132087]|uniref:Acyl-CoA dehydrogenase n=1 Tax=Nakamurella alba TaxID=2665158 RepID=A0A7K1FQ98_9ACTN|nr:acyl-CoA dehydrogenase family protein [Nakamurella alba]MTD16316.1 acyl-CoA dehydrogenase [Nakamurella alba]
MSELPPGSPLAGSATLRAWLDDHREDLAVGRADPADTLDERVDRGSQLWGRLSALGVALDGWPVDAGGRGGTAVHRAVLYDGLVAAGLVLPESAAALEVVGAALTSYAPALARRHLPALLAGEELWCQGFSETEAGSDLASLRTRAERSEVGWKVTGHKIWTSLGHRATHCAVLARTSDTTPRHRGLALVWVPMTTPGVTARPLDSVTGEPEFSEVFFDGVEVPADHLIGEPGQGWAIAMHMLQFERGMWAWQRQALMHAMLGRALAGVGDGLEPVSAAAVGEAYSALSALRSRALATVEALAAGTVLGPEVSIDKLMLGRTEHLVQDAVRRLAGPDFVLGGTTEDAHRRGEWFYSRAATVYGGAAEVQRNIVAERVLGLGRSA